MYDIIFSRGLRHLDDHIVIHTQLTLEQAVMARKVSGDLVVISGTTRVLTDPCWLWMWEIQDADSYAHRAILLEKERQRRMPYINMELRARRNGDLLEKRQEELLEIQARHTQEVGELCTKIQILVDFLDRCAYTSHGMPLLEDHAFTFADGDTWFATGHEPHVP